MVVTCLQAYCHWSGSGRLGETEQTRMAAASADPQRLRERFHRRFPTLIQCVFFFSFKERQVIYIDRDKTGNDIRCVLILTRSDNQNR